MIRRLLEFCISRSLDDGTPLPGWLHAIAQRDARLRGFADQTSQLDAALRKSAAQHRQSMNADEWANNRVSNTANNTVADTAADRGAW